MSDYSRLLVVTVPSDAPADVRAIVADDRVEVEVLFEGKNTLPIFWFMPFAQDDLVQVHFGGVVRDWTGGGDAPRWVLAADAEVAAERARERMRGLLRYCATELFGKLLQFVGALRFPSGKRALLVVEHGELPGANREELVSGLEFFAHTPKELVDAVERGHGGEFLLVSEECLANGDRQLTFDDHPDQVLGYRPAGADWDEEAELEESELEDLLAGDAEAVERFLDGDEDATSALVEGIRAGAPPSPDFARSCWEVDPDLEMIFDVVRERDFALWMRECCALAFPRSHDACINARIQYQTLYPDEDDCGFAEARVLEADLLGEHPDHPRLAVVAMLVARGASVIGDHAAARDAASRALDRFTATGDDEGVDAARRRLAGALLSLRDWGPAFAWLDRALTRRGPGEAGPVIVSDAEPHDSKQAAIDEACQVALWAQESTREWVRAIGALAEAFSDDPIGADLDRRFAFALTRITSDDDFAVVVAQLRERSCLRSAMIAARAGADAHPDNTLLRSVLANLARGQGQYAVAYPLYLAVAKQLEAMGSGDASSAWMNAGDAAAALGMRTESDAAFDRAGGLVRTDEQREQLDFFFARALHVRDPKAAVERAFALVRALESDPSRLAGSPLGLGTVEMLLGWLVAARDPRALDVQETMFQAMRSLWGDCAAVWLERHKLALLHAQLGNHEQARSILEETLRHLLQLRGEGDPNVELCRRSLAQLEH